MQTQALLEELPNGRFRVTGADPFAVRGEGATEEEAVADFQRAARSARWITVEVPREEAVVKHPVPKIGNEDDHDPLPKNIGRGASIPDETWESYLRILQELREEENARVPLD